MKIGERPDHGLSGPRATYFRLMVSSFNLSHGRNEICFFIADASFGPKFLILDSESVTKFGP